MIQLSSRLGTPLDRAAVARLVANCGDGGAEVVASVLGTLFDDAPRLLERLHGALREADPDGARRAAHTLKSHGLTFGAPCLAHVALEIERRARDRDLGGAGRLVADLEAEYERARVALVGLRAELLDGARAGLAA